MLSITHMVCMHQGWFLGQCLGGWLVGGTPGVKAPLFVSQCRALTSLTTGTLTASTPLLRSVARQSARTFSSPLLTLAALLARK